MKQMESSPFPADNNEEVNALEHDLKSEGVEIDNPEKRLEASSETPTETPATDYENFDGVPAAIEPATPEDLENRAFEQSKVRINRIVRRSNKHYSTASEERAKGNSEEADALIVEAKRIDRLLDDKDDEVIEEARSDQEQFGYPYYRSEKGVYNTKRRKSVNDAAKATEQSVAQKASELKKREFNIREQKVKEVVKVADKMEQEAAQSAREEAELDHAYDVEMRELDRQRGPARVREMKDRKAYFEELSAQKRGRDKKPKQATANTVEDRLPEPAQLPEQHEPVQQLTPETVWIPIRKVEEPEVSAEPVVEQTTAIERVQPAPEVPTEEAKEAKLLEQYETGLSSVHDLEQWARGETDIKVLDETISTRQEALKTLTEKLTQIINPEPVERHLRRLIDEQRRAIKILQKRKQELLSGSMELPSSSWLSKVKKGFKWALFGGENMNKW
jgi:hypothetical protein